jgi:hypothetical protein
MGRGGSIAEAPRLNEPKKWDIYKALGGDVAFKENPEEMKKQMQTVHLALIRYGSIYWNKERDQIHPEIKLNFSLTDDPHGVLDPLMYGIQQAPTLITIKKIQGEIKKNRGLKIDKNEMYWLAAHSVYQYVKTFDQGGPIGGIFVSENK